MKRFIQILLVVVILVLPVVTVAAQGANPPADAGGVDLVYVGQLLQALILAVVPVLAAAVAKWFVEKARVERARLTNEQQFALDVFIKTAVYAAEQMQLAGFIGDKLTYATVQVQDWLTSQKIYIDVSEIRARIEAAVFTEFNGFAVSADDNE
jgi:hypothetical protein